MSIHGRGLKPGSMHTLAWAHKPEKTTDFEWTGKSWSTPGTGWGSKPAGMIFAGWKYVGPVSSRAKAAGIPVREG